MNFQKEKVFIFIQIKNTKLFQKFIQANYTIPLINLNNGSDEELNLTGKNLNEQKRLKRVCFSNRLLTYILRFLTSKKTVLTQIQKRSCAP